MNIGFLLGLFFVLEFKRTICGHLNISSKESVFVTEKNDSKTIEIVYKQPLEDKLKVLFSYGDLQATKELEQSKYQCNVYTDNQIISVQSNLNEEIFTIHSICKFDHDKQTFFSLDKFCCELTLRNSTNFHMIFDRKFCKLEITSTSSACYSQLEIAKKNFDFLKLDGIELKIHSRIFTSQDSKCLTGSNVVENLVFGNPLQIIINQEIQMKWEMTDKTKSFGELEIGIPVDSIDLNSKTLFPLRIRSPSIFSNIDIICSLGSALSLSSISFESAKYEGDFSKTKNHLFIMTLNQKENALEMGDPLGDQVVNLRVGLSNKRIRKGSEDWISCKVKKAIIAKTKSEIHRKSVNESKKVYFKVNEDNFIIIPIFEEMVFFKILKSIFGPIQLEEKDLKIFMVHNINDGSLVDVTWKTKCEANSVSSLKCPFENKYNLKRNLIRNPDWKVVLKMDSWQKMITLPISLWRGEDWRLSIGDKSLNRIKNWNYPSTKKPTQECTPVFQKARARLFGRLLKVSIGKYKTYFGQSISDHHPLLDMTSELTMGNMHLSNKNVDISLENNIIFLTAKSNGTTDFSVVDDEKEKIAFDRITVDDQLVSVKDIDISCIFNLYINETENLYDVSFGRLTVDFQESKTPNESCYFLIKLIFSDGTFADLLDYNHTKFQLLLQHGQHSLNIQNYTGFLYEPYKYPTPGRFNLYLMESIQCKQNKVIIKKQVDLYNINKQNNQPPKSILPNTTNRSIGIEFHTSDLSTNSQNIKHRVTTTLKIDTETLFLSMKILIGLVSLVMVIIIINCIIKFHHRKSACLLDHSLNNCQIYSANDKLTTSAYCAIDNNNQNCNIQHPPLLPPPGPLHNSSDSSQLDLALHATPDIFWGLPHSDNSSDGNINNNNNIIINNINNNNNKHHVIGLPLHAINETRTNISFSYMFPSSTRTSSSPNSENFDFSANGMKHSKSRTMHPSQNGYNNPSNSVHDSDSLASDSESKNSSLVAVIVPPCPPLRWNKNWSSNQYPVFFHNDKDVIIDQAKSQFSNENSSLNSLAPSQNSSWDVKQSSVSPPVGFNSIEDVCEKSSGLGSLTSIQQ